MSEPRQCYAITSGAYSDYSVSCIFENLKDAKRYLLLANPGHVLTEEDGEWQCHKPDARPFYDDDRVETFDFYPSGVVPHANA